MPTMGMGQEDLFPWALEEAPGQDCTPSIDQSGGSAVELYGELSSMRILI
jgi:hypothetical protein